MRIGFPFLLPDSNQYGGVVWLSAERAATPNPRVRVVNDVGQETYISSTVSGLDPFFSRVMGSWNLTMEVPSGVEVRENEFPIGGTSGTACAFVFTTLIDQIVQSKSPAEVLISGTARQEPATKRLDVQALGEKGGVGTKYHGTHSGQDFWIHRNDWRFLNAQDASHANLHVFVTPNARHETFGNGEWLLHEFCEKYGISRPPRPQSKPEDKRSDDPRTELDLFEAALTEHNASEFEAALRSFCSPNRPLLELQVQVMDSLAIRKNAAGVDVDDRGFFRFNYDSKIRHAFISGPTGCGKTSLIYSLIVNVLHMATRLLYLGPVKALVEEFHSNVNQEGFKRLLPEQCRDKLFISTGDHSANDAEIANGQFSLAAMVYEKANVLLSSGTEETTRDLFSSLDAVIIDELQMLQDATRGDVLDVLIAKLALENERRAVGSKQPIQLVMISTEGIVSEIKDLGVFINVQERGRPMPPLTFGVARREPSVKHVIYHPVENDEGKSDWREAQICVFAHQNDRNMSEAEINFKMRELSRLLQQARDGRTSGSAAKGSTPLRANPILKSIAESIKRPETLKKVARATAVNAIYSLIGTFEAPRSSRELPHHSVIVACNATSSCDSFAGGLFAIRERSGRFYASELPAHFQKALDESEFDATRKTQLREWAELGVFVHNSQLPTKVRHAIEVIFREHTFPNSRCRVLFTTETLTYGVNLSASAVVLTDIAFTRSDPVSPTEKPEPEELTPTQFHNLLGRAGRKSFEAEASAVAYISTANSQAGKRPIMDDRMHVETPALHAFLRKFYGEQPYDRYLPISSIAHRSDLDKSGVLPASDSNFHAPILRDFSYSIFRTVLESVRLARSATAKEIKEQFQRTIGYLHASEALKADLNRLFDHVFGLVKDYGIGEFRLLAGRDTLFKLQYQAVALLDTGTSLHAVEPIAAWLEILREDFTNKRPDIELPIEAILPALVAAPEFTQSANELLQVDVLAKQLQTPQSVDDARRDAIALLTEALADSGMTAEYVSAITKYVGGVGGEDAEAAEGAAQRFSVFRGLNVLEGLSRAASAGGFIRDVAYYLLLAGVFRWVQGKPMNAMHSLFVAKHQKGFVGKSWQPKHADRLEQLASMAGKFFSGRDKYLPESMALKLPKFAFRCKYGISEECLVYRRVLSPAEGLPRKVILAIKEHWPDPMKLLATDSPLNVQQVLTRANVDVPHLRDDHVRGVVRTAFAQSASAFLAQLGDDRSAEYLDEAFLALHEPRAAGGDELAFSSHWRAGGLMDAIRKYVPELASELSVGRSAHRFEILEWHAEPGPSKAITPFACLFLGALLRRELISMDWLRGQLATQGAGVTITVAWIASNLWTIDHLTSTPHLREVALAFLEPYRTPAKVEKPAPAVAHADLQVSG